MKESINMKLYRAWFIVGFLYICVTPSRASSLHEDFSDFTTPLPLRQGDTLIVGFLGGWQRWDAPRGVRKTALELREMKLPGVFVETVENHKRELAAQLVEQAWPRGEASAARVILYGQSFGGMAVVRLADELKRKGIPVMLAVMVDAVGHNSPIPPNVRAAVNFFQRGSCPICGPRHIQAEDPSRTQILGDFEWTYRHKNIDLHTEPWVRRFFEHDHEQMEFDPDVWSEVKKLVVKAAAH
jgi:hypothetical protein